MSTINNVANSPTVPFITSFAPNTGTAALSPESLLLYCSSRLEALDTNIRQYFVEQQRRNAGIRDASKLLEILQSGTWGTGQMAGNGDEWNKNPGFHAQNHADKANEILDLWRSTESPEVKLACANAFKQVSGLDIGNFPGSKDTVSAAQVSAAAGNIPAVTREARQAQVEAIKNEQATMTKAAEMNMIQLQSLVQQRQLAVQLTTQLMQTMHECAKQPLGNLRT